MSFESSFKPINMEADAEDAEASGRSNPLGKQLTMQPGRSRLNRRSRGRASRRGRGRASRRGRGRASRRGRGRASRRSRGRGQR